MKGTSNGPRAVALVGPAGAGKTSLAEAMLHASGAIARQGNVAAGTSVGDASAEARARGGSISSTRRDRQASRPTPTWQSSPVTSRWW